MHSSAKKDFGAQMVLRWLVGLPLAALITACLFLVMSFLIRQEFSPEPPKETPTITITAQKKETSDRDPIRERPVLPDQPDPPSIDLPEGDGAPDGGDFGIGPTNPVDSGDRSRGDLAIVGLTIPVPPTYPQRCASKGAQGVVVVEFDVTAKGEVVNARILSSPDSCFDRPVLQAISKWRYSPNLVDGRPAPRTNVIERFRFELQ